MKISQCTTGSFKNLSLPSINRCLAKSQELQSAERLVGAVEVVPGKGIIIESENKNISSRLINKTVEKIVSKKKSANFYHQHYI